MHKIDVMQLLRNTHNRGNCPKGDNIPTKHLTLYVWHNIDSGKPTSSSRGRCP